MTADPTWNFLEAASKGRIIGTLDRQMSAMFELAEDPAHWQVATACEGWELRDMIGHLVDATEGYLSGIELARRGRDAPPPVGMSGMAKASDDAARAFRDTSREDLLARLRSKSDGFVRELESLSDEEWSSLLVRDPYLGPLPAMVVAIGLLSGYAVHGWDVRQGLGAAHAIDADTADLLVPFTFLLWQATADTSSVANPYAIGVRTTGRNGGDTRIDVSAKGVRLSTGDLDGCAAVLEVDPGTLVLTAYNRVNAGTVHGDAHVVADFRSRLVAI
jgi:uncharacterized protein (TIGR03083 family)